MDTTSAFELVADVATSRTGDWKRTSSFHFLARARAMLTSFPGFIFSTYSQTAQSSFALISMREFERIMKRAQVSSYAGANGTKSSIVPAVAPRRALYVRVKEVRPDQVVFFPRIRPDIPQSATSIEREDLVNELRTFVQDERVVITNMADILSATDTAIVVLNIFFILVALMIIVLCFFLLFVSFTSNVTENAWEFGVLRALGMTVCPHPRSNLSLTPLPVLGRGARLCLRGPGHCSRFSGAGLFDWGCRVHHPHPPNHSLH